MIKIKLYYSIVAILFFISCVSNKGNDFLSIPIKPIYGFYYDKEIISNELVTFSSLDCGILMVQRCKFSGEPICQILAYIIHSGFISGYQNRYGDNLKPPTNVYHRMTA